MRVSGAFGFRWFVCCCLGLGLASVYIVPAGGQQPAAPSPEPPTLKLGVAKLAGDIAKYMEQDRKAKELEVKPYLCDPKLNASAGPGIQKLLIDELNKRGISHKQGSAITCEGEYTYLHEQNRVVIETQLLDRGVPKYSYQPIKTGVTEVADIFAVTGATGVVAVDDTKKRLGDALAAVLTPQVQLVGQTQASASAPQQGPTGPVPPPFAIELCRKNPQTGEYIAVGLANREGDAFAQLADTDVYGLRVYNRAPFHVAVSVTVDGLNMFVLSEVPGYRQLGKLIIPPGKDHLIKGWHVRDDLAKEFLVTQLPGALVATLNGPSPLKNPEEVSTITASFSAAAIGPNDRLPPDEPDIRSLGTAAGAPVETSYKQVPAIFGKVREVVSIRYDRPADLPPGGENVNPIVAGK